MALAITREPGVICPQSWSTHEVSLPGSMKPNAPVAIHRQAEGD